MKVIVNSISGLSSAQYIALFRLNKHDTGLMQDALRTCKYQTEGKAYWIEKDGKTVAWALVWKDWNSDLVAYFYTKKSERRKGYGKAIAEEIKKNHTVLVHHEENEGFFNAVGLTDATK